MHTELEEALVLIIANAGDSKSNSVEAITAAKSGEFEKARSYLKLGEAALEKAHDVHTQLLVMESKNKLPVTLLMIHASNHLSEAESARLFAEEVSDLYEKIAH